MGPLVVLGLAIATATYAWFTYGRGASTVLVGRLIVVAALFLWPFAIVLFVFLRFRSNRQRNSSTRTTGD